MEVQQCLTNLYQVGNTKGTRKITRFRRFFYQLHGREKTARNIIFLTKSLVSLIFHYLPEPTSKYTNYKKSRHTREARSRCFRQRVSRHQRKYWIPVCTGMTK